MTHELDIPDFLKIPPSIRAAAWRDHKFTRPRRTSHFHRPKLTAAQMKIAQAADEQARKARAFPILEAWESAQ
jgi:hypothetical protein